MRYLGMSLGMGVALGYCAAFGTLVPPIFKQFMPNLPVGASIKEIATSSEKDFSMLFGGLTKHVARAGITEVKFMRTGPKAISRAKPRDRCAITRMERISA